MCSPILVLTLLQGKQGEIKHVYRGNVFLQARNVLENGGIVVCRANHVELAGGTSNAVSAPVHVHVYVHVPEG